MKTKNLTKKMNFYELIGIILGDGSIIINSNKRVYKFELNGNAEDELDYYQKISNYLKKEFNLNPKIYVKREKLGKTLRLVVDNKKFVSFLKNNIGLNFKNKTFGGYIPNKFIDWNFSKHIIRGIFETDGSIYFSRTKPHFKPVYPRIEIKTSSRKLAEQIISILGRKDFNIRQRTSKGDKTIGIYLSGKKMLEKWIKEIGFSKIKTVSKYLIWKKTGRYFPYMTLSKRLDLLSEGGQAAKASVS